MTCPLRLCLVLSGLVVASLADHAAAGSHGGLDRQLQRRQVPGWRSNHAMLLAGEGN